MSLILDALKKSEAERQRQSGPALLEVRLVKPQRRYPIWALAVGILLLINMVLLLVFVLRPTDGAHVPAVAAYPPSSAVPAQAGPPPSAATPAPQPQAPPSTAAALPSPQALPPQPLAGPASTAPTLNASSDADGNPADDQPAISANAASLRGQRDSPRVDYSALPSINDVSGNVPDLRLDLHVYAERPRDRYALINMQTVHEGDMLHEGARVVAITRDGVALEWRNQQFMLRPQ
jgi:general secretion pathway protein B